METLLTDPSPIKIFTIKYDNGEVAKVQPVRLDMISDFKTGMIVQIKHVDGTIERRLDILTDDEKVSITNRAMQKARDNNEDPRHTDFMKYAGEIYWWMIK